jgi:tetratricopeptide (TPR) repeat protein
MSEFSAPLTVEEEDIEFLDAVEGPPTSEAAPSKISELETAEAESDNADSYNKEENDDGHERSIDEALSAKEEGNTYFREKYYHQALEMYTKAIHMCPLGEEFQEQMAVFYGNRAACYSALNDLDMVIADCTHALDLNGSYIKVLMRRCQAFEYQEKYDEAIIGNYIHYCLFDLMPLFEKI